MDGVLNTVTQFVTSASLWLQVPLVMVVAVPLAAVFAVALLRLVDGGAHAWNRFWSRPYPAGSTRPESPDAGAHTGAVGPGGPGGDSDSPAAGK